MGNKIIFVGVA